MRRGGVIGTYLHGPLLPKNAWFADWLIREARAPGSRSRSTTASRTPRTPRRAAPPGPDAGPDGPPAFGSRYRIRPVGDPSAHSSAETLTFRDVTKRYPGTDRPAVDALSLEVPAGEICVLVGPSGCGKTTAMRMVNRMIDITAGDILLDGRCVNDRKPAELRREIGYAIQQIGLFPHRTIADNIATVPKLLGWDKERITARVDELLELVGLDRRRDARPLPRAALGRPAPARRRGPGARGRPAAAC